MSQPPEIPEIQSKGIGKGCLIGCLVALVIGIALVVGLGFLAYNVTGTLVEGFTDDAPVQLPITVVPAEQQAELKDRVETFTAAFEEPNESATIELSAEELNALISTYAQELPVPLNEWIHLTIEDDILGGEVSVPLDQVAPPGTPFVEGRYVNGAATFTTNIQNGRLQVYVESLEVKGHAVPEEAMVQMRNENLAKEFNNQPDSQALLQRIEDITIENGKLAVTLTGEE
jgi:hypothetical protein